MVGKTFYQYSIIEKLAEDAKLNRKVALKFLPTHLTADKESKERYKREAQSAAALNHPNIITIHEINEYKDQTYFAMEFVEGETLRSKIEKGDLKTDESIDILKQLCEGLLKAHNAGIIHRDIKPENIIIDRESRVRILDFGLAKLRGSDNITKELTTLGTLKYMSPEQIKGNNVDHRTDIWSLGVIFFEMLTGKLPFDGDYDAALIYSILNEEFQSGNNRKKDLPNEILDICKKALKKSPENRYQSASQIIIDLEKIDYDTISIDNERKKRKLNILYLVKQIHFHSIMIMYQGILRKLAEKPK